MYGTMSNLLRLLLCAICISTVKSGQEHTCSITDFQARPQITSLCGARLPAMIGRRCGSAGIYIGKRSIQDDMSVVHRPPFALSHQEANQHFTNDKRNSMNSRGIICECCLHRCNSNEMNQYCGSEKNRRRRRSISSSGKGFITQADVDAFYEELERDIYQESNELISLTDKPARSQDQQTAKMTDFSNEPKRTFGDYLPSILENRLLDEAEEELELRKIMTRHLIRILAKNTTVTDESANTGHPGRPSLSQEQKKQLAQILLDEGL